MQQFFKWHGTWYVCLLGGSVDGQVNEAVGVSPLVIVPGDDLVEVVVEEDAGITIDGGRVLVMDKVRANKHLIGVSKDTLEFRRLGGLLEGSENFRTFGGLFGAEGQVDDGDISGGDLWCAVVEGKDEEEVKGKGGVSGRQR